MKPDKDAIKTEVDTLKAMKPAVRHFTTFHDDNWKAIEAQVLVLENGLDDGDIYKRWPNDDEDMHMRDNALEAYHWMVGELDDPPSAGWISLVL